MPVHLPSTHPFQWQPAHPSLGYKKPQSRARRGSGTHRIKHSLSPSLSLSLPTLLWEEVPPEAKRRKTLPSSGGRHRNRRFFFLRHSEAFRFADESSSNRPPLSREFTVAIPSFFNLHSERIQPCSVDFMSSQSSPRRGMKKYARDSIRRKSSLHVEPNVSQTPPEDLRPVGTFAVASVVPAAVEMVVEAATSEIAASLIDVEAIEDDDVQMLSSPRAFPQGRNQLRNSPVTVVIDDLESSTGTSVVNVDDLSEVPLQSFRRHRRVSPDRIIINCQAYVNIEGDQNAKSEKLESAQTEQKAVPKEPVISCPICMNSLVDACSTICGHVFCHACIRQAIKSQKSCPTCRRKLRANNFHRLYLPISK